MKLNDDGAVSDVGSVTWDVDNLIFETGDKALRQGLSTVARQRHVTIKAGLRVPNIKCVMIAKRVPISDPTFIRALESHLMRFSVVRLVPIAAVGSPGSASRGIDCLPG